MSKIDAIILQSKSGRIVITHFLRMMFNADEMRLELEPATRKSLFLYDYNHLHVLYCLMQQKQFDSSYVKPEMFNLLAP